MESVMMDETEQANDERGKKMYDHLRLWNADQSWTNSSLPEAKRSQFYFVFSLAAFFCGLLSANNT